MRLGEFQVDIIVDNRFLIDGGAMFGVVPKRIWQGLVPADTDNLVPLDMNVLVVRTGRGTVAVDTGMGDTLNDKQRRIFGLRTPSQLLRGLQALGVSRHEVDVVLFTHLHADHAGGAITVQDGRWEPTFPRARHVVQDWEWEDALAPNERTAAAYLTPQLQLLWERGLVDLVHGECEVYPGIKVRLTGGHCRGHQMVEVISDHCRLACLGDLLPTAAHVRLPYIAGVDTFPLRTLEVKKELFPILAAELWLLALDHDLEIKLARMVEKDGSFELAVVQEQTEGSL